MIKTIQRRNKDNARQRTVNNVSSFGKKDEYGRGASNEGKKTPQSYGMRGEGAVDLQKK